MRVIESIPVPTDSISFILAHLETERSYYEAAESNKQFDRVLHHAARVREWLSSIDRESAHPNLSRASSAYPNVPLARLDPAV
jgi:hypothetical protein